MVSFPANAMLPELIVMIIESDIAPHVPLPIDVKVNITFPEAESAEVILYDAFNESALGLNVPVPLVLHCAVVVELPLRFTMLVPAQIVWLLPASTVGARSNVNCIESLELTQLFMEVNVSITDPAARSEAPGR